MHMKKLLCIFLFFFAYNLFSSDFVICPLKPDPPIEIDGKLEDWMAVPLRIPIDKKEKVVYGMDKWKGINDLSGTIYLCWRYEGLYIGIEVIDDKIVQEFTGKDFWKGDHIEIYIDTDYQIGQKSEPFKDKQFQIGLNPGNFLNTDDPIFDIKPESYIWHPEGKEPVGIKVWSEKTEEGYNIEGFIPFELLGIKAKQGTLIGIDICISDTDQSGQEKMTSLIESPWKCRDRGRLTGLYLGNAEGKLEAVTKKDVPETVEIFKEEKIVKGGKKEFKFNATKPKDKSIILSFKAILKAKTRGGNTFAMKIYLNGKEIEKGNLVNRPLEFTFLDGRSSKSWTITGFVVYYAPDFSEIPRDNRYYPVEGFNPYNWEFDITDLIKDGENLLIIENTARVDNELIVGEGKIEYKEVKEVKEKEEVRKEREELKFIGPKEVKKFRYRLEVGENGEISVKVGNDIYEIYSNFFTKYGTNTIGKGYTNGWDSLKLLKKGKNYIIVADGKNYKLEREIISLEESIEVRDRLENKTDKNIGFIIKHFTKAEPQKFYLGGMTVYGKGIIQSPPNPTTVLITNNSLIGFLAEDDVFKVHSTNYYIQGEGGITDRNFVLKGKGTYQFKWSIFPLEETDYYDFVNAARRKLDVNFTIPGAFGFVLARPPLLDFSVEQLREYLENKSIIFATSSIHANELNASPYRHQQGTAFQKGDYSNYKKLLAKIKQAKPDTKYLIYYHCFLDITEDGPQKFFDSRALNPDGSQADYGNPIYKSYFPTLTNSYGKVIGKNVDIILNEIKADGIYWDEFSNSRPEYHYGEPWDGVSADIDPKTGEIKRYKSSVTLISQPWRIQLVEKILNNGKILIANGAPKTETEKNYKFPRFTETGSINNCVKTHLYTPIALGDHLTEKTEKDSYEVMLKALNYGCVYYWYNDRIIPTHKTLTSYMYPVTPVEIHSGYIIGKERIITAKSGYFSFGDMSEGEVHFFDSEGKEIKKDVEKLTKDGKRYFKIELGENESAVIVKKK